MLVININFQKQRTWQNYNKLFLYHILWLSDTIYPQL